MKKVVIFAGLLFLISCQKKSEESTGDVAHSPSFENERKAFFNSLLNPRDAAARLQATGAAFNAHLLSDPEHFTQYVNNDVKAAANLGVYLADLNYCTVYKKADHIKAIFPAVHALSKSIGIEQSVLDFLMQRYNENLANNDSVKTVVDELYSKAVGDVEGTSRERPVGIAMSSYQIENLHLALGLIESYPDDKLTADERTQILVPIYRAVLEQESNVEIIYGFLRSITDVTNPEQNPNYPYYAQSFEELIAVYRKLNMADGGAIHTAENDSVFAELSAKVEAIRSKIIAPE